MNNLLFREAIYRLLQIVSGAFIFDFPVFINFRLALFKIVAKISKGCIIGNKTIFYVPHGLKRQKVILGENVKIAHQVEIDCCRKISIMDKVWVSQHTQILSHTHKVDSRTPKENQEVIVNQDLIIQEDSWLGANVIIMPKVNYIGKGVVIGAGSVVTKNIDDYSIIAGNPAKVIGYR